MYSNFLGNYFEKWKYKIRNFVQHLKIGNNNDGRMNKSNSIVLDELKEDRSC